MNFSIFHSCRALFILIGVLLLINGALAFFVLRVSEPGLIVTFLDVRQGDSILVRGPSGLEMLIDGGPDRSVLRRLPRELGILDRSISIIVVTHPDKDHIAGLTEALLRYDVTYLLDSGVRGDSVHAKSFEDAIEKEVGIERITVRRGMRIHLGDGAYADVLFPDRDVSGVETNTGSVALRIVYGSTSFLLAGDLPMNIEDYLATLDGTALKSDVLKASHHGSKTSTSAFWLAAVQPKIFVVSAGKDNSYGHPAPEVTDRARSAGAVIVSTIDEGTISFISDGHSIQKR